MPRNGGRRKVCGASVVCHPIARCQPHRYRNQGQVPGIRLCQTSSLSRNVRSYPGTRPLSLLDGDRQPTGQPKTASGTGTSQPSRGEGFWTRCSARRRGIPANHQYSCASGWRCHSRLGGRRGSRIGQGQQTRRSAQGLPWSSCG